MKKALASDFDNTLYFMDTEERFRAQDVFEILFFRKEGGVFGICTGRSPDSILETCGSFLHPDFIISVSGALIVDGEGKVLHSHTLSPETARAILREFDGEAIMVVHAGGNVYAFGETEYPLQISIREFEELPLDAIYGISMRLASEKAAEEAAARIREKYGADAAPYQNVRHVDVVAAGCSKGTGLDKVREIFGIDRFGGIGDSYNDLPLLEASDISFTFPDAPEELRKAADEIVLSVSDAIDKMR